MAENVENTDVGEESGNKKVELVQEVCGYSIYRNAKSFTVKYPSGGFGGYFSSLGGCAREIISNSLTDKTTSRSAQDKKNLDSFLGTVEGHEKFVKKVLAALEEVRVKNVVLPSDSDFDMYQ